MLGRYDWQVNALARWRGWLERKDVINTLPVAEFLGALRAKPGTGKGRSKQARSA
jgi:hypothetical protein